MPNNNGNLQKFFSSISCQSQVEKLHPSVQHLNRSYIFIYIHIFFIHTDIFVIHHHNCILILCQRTFCWKLP